MNDPQERVSAQPKLPPPAWLAAFAVMALVVGTVSGGVVALIVDGGGDEKQTAADADAVAKATARALPSTVIVVDDMGNAIGTGAGVIIDDRGFIMTNAHVIQGTGKLFVVLANGEQRPATLVASDAPFTDLAVVRIAPGGLRSVGLGRSEDLTPGQTVIAIGSPDFDYQNTVTVGVVSGVQRTKLLNGVVLDDLIQTDAAINAGNSGGPLVNLKGEVVGMVTFRDLGGDDDLVEISFALSSRTIRPIVQSMIDRGVYPRPYFGIDHVDLNPATSQQLGAKAQQGALVQRVIADSPAAAAGIRVGDVITKIGTFDLSAQLTFISALAKISPNSRVPVQVLRDGQIGTLTLEMPAR